MNVKTIEMCTMTTCQKLLLFVMILTVHAYLLLAILTQIFSKIKVTQGIKCNDPNCLNHSHQDEIDELYDSIVSSIKKCSHAFVSSGKHISKEVLVPGWNEQVKELHDAARHAYLTWREIGKPRQGDVFTMMKLSRSKFKYALRKCKRDKETIIADNIAEKLCQKDNRDFWKNIKHMTNTKVKLPTNIGWCSRR